MNQQALRDLIKAVLNEDIKVFHKGHVDTIPGEFQIGDRVITFDLPKDSPYTDKEGTVVHVQTDDVRVKLDGMTDEYGEGFNPTNLIRIPPKEQKKQFRVLTPEEKKQMMFDALTMSEAGWMKKYSIGDYGDYKDMATRNPGIQGLDFGKINMNEKLDELTSGGPAIEYPDDNKPSYNELLNALEILLGILDEERAYKSPSYKPALDGAMQTYANMQHARDLIKKAKTK